MAGSALTLARRIRECRICAARFSKTATQHTPRPVVWFEPNVRLLVAGQAPGLRVHEAGKPFFDRSGERLRDWMGVTDAEFYDRRRVAIVPMAFCFPGYDAKGADLPPPAICAETWHADVMASLPDRRLTLLVGRYAQAWHLGAAVPRSVTETVADWQKFAPDIIPLPHPSWRNTGWLKRNRWFETELVPYLKRAVRAALDSP